jgi:hypothetical protein
MARVGQMRKSDSLFPSDPEVLRLLVKEYSQQGLTIRAVPTSAFESVADVIFALMKLPDAVNVPQIILEAHYQRLRFPYLIFANKNTQ